MEWILILFLLFLMFLLINFVQAFWSLAPWVPTRKKDLKRILLLADLKPGQVLYDLGCGDGRVVFALGQNSKAKIIGIELSWLLFFFCKIKHFFYPLKNISFQRKNLFKQDFSSANVIYVFGLPKTIREKLIIKLKKELQPKTRVISYVFPFPDLKLIQKDQSPKKSNPIYIYEI
jgi:SAM-dependent methyltransferase